MSPAQKKHSQSPKSSPASEPTVEAHSPSEPPSADPIVEPAMDQSSSPVTPEGEQLHPAPTPPKRPVEREAIAVPPQPPTASETQSEPSSEPSEAVQPEGSSSADSASAAASESTVSNPADSPVINNPADNPTSNPTDSSADSSADSPTDSSADHPDEDTTADDLAPLNRLQPIPPASEPMQYRAIGLVRGTYVPSEEQFTRGFVHTDDGVAIDAVLLGRVMSLVKKHLDLAQPHLWVVYPRTREKTNDLHVQIVGVWEPEKLKRSDMEGASDEAETEDGSHEASEAESSEIAEAASSSDTADSQLEMVPSSELDDKFFSIRGEIIFQSPEEERLMVKIRRIARPGDKQDKAFKVGLIGKLDGKAVGYFWDLQVRRQENDLIVQQGTMIALVPPQKRQGGSRKPPGRFQRRGPGGPGGPGGSGGRRPGGPPRKWNAGGREGTPKPQFKSGDRPAPSSQPREVSKPIKRRPPEGAPPAPQE
ncbi:hypothetical protein [Leptolyngbya ohadii]|uniref:hypothetical protein n=1 Tax=Leptolyngbya ohadii TaxID=1962290 RepID=UPI0019D440F1|nr:hypothetical protein [Leptolyngbya ohadii]